MKSAVVYYSLTGNTKKIADKLIKAFDADTYVIEPEDSYLGFGDSVLKVIKDKFQKKEPKSKTKPVDFSEYDTIFLGFPVWANSMPEFMQDFLTRSNITGKTVVPFVTAGKTGKLSSLKTVLSLLPDNFVSNYLFMSQKEKPDVGLWISQLKENLGDSTD